MMAATTGYLGADVPSDHPDYNPYSATACLLTVSSEGPDAFITVVNDLFCALVNWERGNFGDPEDPDVTTQTLIGKPLDVLVPPKYRRAHKLFRQAFETHPVPRTMGEGRNTPVWVKDDGVLVNGLDSITGREVNVIIGLSTMGDSHTLGIVQPLEISRRFTGPELTRV